MRALLKNFSVTYHQFIFFCVHLIILRFLGISYSGEIAYVAAITGVVAVIVSMRWDIEILVRSITNAKESFQKGFVTILLLTGSILFLSFLGIIIFDKYIILFKFISKTLSQIFEFISTAETSFLNHRTPVVFIK